MNAPLPWQTEQWQRAVRLRVEQKLPHALLLQGPSGVGKQCFAKALSKVLLCLSPGPQGACGACRACHLAGVGNHPDELLVAPREDKRVIGIDQIRDLIDRLALTAQAGAYKVAVVSPAESMTHSAANTLLKTLEEPPGESVFMLVSHHSAMLPATIRSRCQTVSFPRPPRLLARRWLTESVETPQEGGGSGDRAPNGEVQAGAAVVDEVDQVLDLAFGAPLAALQLIRDGGVERRKSLVADVAALISNAAGPVTTAAQWQQRGIGEVSTWITSIVQDAIRIKLTDPIDLADREGYSAMHELAEWLDSRQWFRLLDACNEANRSLAVQQYLNEQLALERLALECHAAGRASSKAR